MIYFIRTMAAREFSEEAESFWQGETKAGFVGHMTESNIPQTLDEVIEGCHSYSNQWGDELMSEEMIAYNLLRLLEFGIVGLVFNK